MSGRTRLVVVLVVCSLVVGAWVSAQVIAPEKLDQPITLSGSDVGFRVEARRGNAAVGRLMVRLNGQWVEADFAGELRRLQTH